MNNIIDEIRGFFSGIDVLALYVYIYLKFEFIDVNTVGLLILYLFRMIDKNICLSRLYILSPNSGIRSFVFNFCGQRVVLWQGDI